MYKINEMFYLISTILTRTLDIDLTTNLSNPYIFLKIQFFSLFPSLIQLAKKPYVILIVYESFIFCFLYYRIWNNLFFEIRKSNFAKNIFSIIFIIVTCSYLLLYGIIGYLNVGSAQRFRSNNIPIALIFPLISEKIIRDKKMISIDRKQNNLKLLQK